MFFGATDGPMTNEQLLAAAGKVLHFPMVLGADEHRAYKAVTERILATWHAGDPLARFLYRGERA